MDNNHHQKLDFSQITELIFLGTNLCCLEKSHTQILADIGITAEIDLEKERQEATKGVTIYLWLPAKDKGAPTMEQFAAGVSLMDQMTKRGLKTYVHCHLGHGRSPTMVAAYLISQGKTLAEAMEVIKQARPEAHLEEVQIKALEEYSKTVNT